MIRGSVPSSLTSALKLLIGLPSAEAATGLTNSTWRGSDEIGISVEIDRGLGAGRQGDAIGLADGAAHRHLLGIEDAGQGLAADRADRLPAACPCELERKTFWMRHHAGKRGVDFEPGDVALGAVERDLLAVALEFEDAERGGIRFVVSGVGFFEAFDVFAGDLDPDFGLFRGRFRLEWAFFQLQLGFGEIALGCLQIDGRVFRRRRDFGRAFCST